MLPNLNADDILRDFKDFEFIRDHWLHSNNDVPAQGSLGVAGQTILEKLTSLVQNRNNLEAWQRYDELREFVLDNGTPEQKGDADVACAWVETEIGRLDTAQKLLESAEKRYRTDEHDCAVVTWLLGIVHWRQQADHIWSAIDCWEATRAAFEGLHANIRLDRQRSEWYGNRLQEIETFLDAIQQQVTSQNARPQPGQSDQLPVQPVDQPAPNQPPGSQPPTGAPDPNQPSGSPPSAGAPAQPPNRDIKPPKRVTGRLSSYPILPGAVSAGRLRTLLDQGLPGLDHIYFPQVEINDELYQVFSLRNGAIVSMTGGKSTYVIRIIGDSMDAYPILPDDYVLINTGLAPSPGDVIVTEVIDETDDASHTIKLLKSIDNQEIVLEFVSHNPSYSGKRLVIKNDKKNSAKILGVAVARFSQIKTETGPNHE